MTLEELRRQIQEQIGEAEDAAAKAQALARQTEINLAFLRGQLHALSMIQIEEKPIYSNGVEGTPA